MFFLKEFEIKWVSILLAIAGIAGIIYATVYFNHEDLVEDILLTFVSILLLLISMVCCVTVKRGKSQEITTQENMEEVNLGRESTTRENMEEINLGRETTTNENGEATNLYEQLNAQKRQIQDLTEQ